MKTVLYCVLFAFSLCSCGDSGLSKEQAKEIIDASFRDNYDLSVPDSILIELGKIFGYQGILSAAKLGVVTTKQVDSVIGQFGARTSIEKPNVGDKFTITVTEKGKAVPHLNDVYGNTCFLTSHSNIIEILEISKSQDNRYTVLFSFSSKYTDFGKSVALAAKELNPPWAWSDDNTRFRGKATIVYDAFLNKFVLTDLIHSDWDKEAWRSLARITIDKGVKTVTYSGLKP